MRVGVLAVVSQQLINRGGGAFQFVAGQGDGRFIAKIIAPERFLLREQVPKFEGLLLARARKKTRDGANGLRFGRTQLVGGGGFVARVGPVLLLDQRECLVGMTPRLPAFDGVAGWLGQKDHGKPEHDCTQNQKQKAAAISPAETQLLRGHHVFVVACAKHR